MREEEMKDLRSGKAIALTQGEIFRGDAFALLGFCFLFGVTMVAVLAMHGFPAP